MCTVTYLPLNGPAHFILTNNRDEAPHRHASVLFYNGDTQFAYPREPIAGGTWLVLSAQRRLVCLLNGADFAHKRQTPYAKAEAWYYSMLCNLPPLTILPRVTNLKALNRLV